MVSGEINLPESLHESHHLILELNQKISHLSQEFEGKIEAMNGEYNFLLDQMRLLKLTLYGKKSEKYPFCDTSDQPGLFNEPGEEQAEETPKEELITVPGYTRKKNGRPKLPNGLPRKEVIYDIPESEKTCDCGKAMVCIGDERSEKLIYIPPVLEVEVNIRLKYGCECEGEDSNGNSIKIAPVPVQLIPKGIATASLVAHIITAKYCDSIPFYRQENQFKRLGIELSRASMCNWGEKVYELGKPIEKLMSQLIKDGPLIQVDETTHQVLKEKDRKAEQKSYMWVARGGPPDKPVIYYHYAPSRGSKVVRKLLGDYQGYVQTDGYAGYDYLDYVEGVTHVGCWYHARRGFIKVVKAGSKNKKNGKAEEMVGLIRKLSQVERQADNLEFIPEERLQLRLEKSKPVVDKIKVFLKENKDKVPPKSLLGKAIQYMINQWPRLLHFLEDGRVPLSTNRIENDIRPFVVGRKNWLFNVTPEGARASAFYYSLIETARANGMEPFSYLMYLFTNLPHARAEEDYIKLLPQNADRNQVAEYVRK